MALHDGALDPNEPCTTNKECRLKFTRQAQCMGPRQVCVAGCKLNGKCTPIDRDPALIRFSSSPAKLDRFFAHGRFAVFEEVDPTLETFTVTLSNEFAHKTIKAKLIA